LSLNSLVLIFKENNTDQSESWKEFFKLLHIQNESTIIELSNESIKFRSILVKSYYQNDHVDDENSSSSLNILSFIEFENEHLAIDSIVRIIIHYELLASSKRDRERSRKYSISIVYLNFTLNSITADSSFIASRQQKIVELLEKGIFLSVNKAEMLVDIRIFSFRFVNEIKHSKTNKVLRLRSQYEYATPSHLIVALNQTSLLDSLNNSSVNRISRFIDHAQIFSERAKKWTKDLRRKFYWTIHEEIHLMIFLSRSENDIKTTN
jgi:hypothetical protein